MIIDCDACAVRDLECDDCVVTVMLGMPPVRGSVPETDEAVTAFDPVDLDAREQAAIAVLAQCGLIPPLRLVAAADVTPSPPPREDEDGRPVRRRAAG
jgi:alkylhydroperoxidase family enzyme